MTNSPLAKIELLKVASLAVGTCLVLSTFVTKLKAETDFAVPAQHIQFLTGDSWVQGENTVRLFGVQACLRGSKYTDNNRRSQDCGAVSLAFLAALVRDGKPSCSPIATISGSPTGRVTILVVCKINLRGIIVDLGSIMVTQGFAFAALANDGKPVYMPYQLQESVARQAKSGLWAYADLPVPSLNDRAQNGRLPKRNESYQSRRSP